MKRTHRFRTAQHGMTLIEILVVLVLIGIVLGIVGVSVLPIVVEMVRVYRGRQVSA